MRNYRFHHLQRIDDYQFNAILASPHHDGGVHLTAAYGWRRRTDQSNWNIYTVVNGHINKLCSITQAELEENKPRIAWS